jgi:ADP-ribosylglycohydrolase
MALCLAESLVETPGFDPDDQMRRYVCWYREGYLSSTGRCFDIGNTMRNALIQYERTGNPYSGSTDPHTAGNGSLMRLAPVAMFYANDAEEAVAKCGDSSRTTHAAPTAVDACRFFGGLLVGALSGQSKTDLLKPGFTVTGQAWKPALQPLIADIAQGTYQDKKPPKIRGSGYVVEALEAALWAFYHSTDFRSGCLLAANLGDDADTTAAIYGQIAGAHYGVESIPEDWLTKLTMREHIEELARALYQHARRHPETS